MIVLYIHNRHLHTRDVVSTIVSEFLQLKKNKILTLFLAFHLYVNHYMTAYVQVALLKCLLYYL